MKTMIAMAALLASGTAMAEPADIAASVAAEGRTAENVERDEGRKPVAVLQWAGVEQGDRVFDGFGANLYWAEIIAPAIGAEGRYTIGNASQFYNEEAQARVAGFKETYPWVDEAVSTFENPQLDDEAYDFIIINLNVHDFWWESEDFGISAFDPASAIGELADALVPGGKLLVIDHRGKTVDDTREQVNSLHRIDPAVVIEAMGDAGLFLKATSNLLANADDPLDVPMFDPAVRGNTDRFVHLYVKPE